MNLHELHGRAVATRSDRDIEDFLRGAKDFVRFTVFSLLKRRNLRVHRWLADDVASDVVALIGEKTGRLLRGDIRNICGFLHTMTKHEVTESVDNLLPPCGLGPVARTRRRRFDDNEDEFSPGELHKRVYYDYDPKDTEDGVFEAWVEDKDLWSNYPIEYDSDSHRRSSLPAVYGDPYHAGMWDETYRMFLAWVEQAAWKLIGDDPRLRLAYGLIKIARDRPNIEEIAATVRMPRQTLRDRLDRLGERIFAAAPEWVHEAGRTYWRRSWRAREGTTDGKAA